MALSTNDTIDTFVLEMAGKGDLLLTQTKVNKYAASLTTAGTGSLPAHPFLTDSRYHLRILCDTMCQVANANPGDFSGDPKLAILK